MEKILSGFALKVFVLICESLPLPKRLAQAGVAKIGFKIAAD